MAATAVVSVVAPAAGLVVAIVPAAVALFALAEGSVGAAARRWVTMRGPASRPRASGRRCIAVADRGRI